MIDLHNHLLPGLDDGPDNWAETLTMCRMAAADGISTIVATPHVEPVCYPQVQGRIQARTETLNILLEEEGINLQVVPGADVRLDPQLLQLVAEQRAPTLGQAGKFLLLELPSLAFPPQTEDFVFKLLLQGITPVISHPERNTVLQQQPERLARLIHCGALSQVTSMSLTGEFGSQVRRCAQDLVRQGLVHILATDAHSADRRPPYLSRGVEAAAELVGEARARNMVTTLPRAILDSQMVIESRSPQAPSSLGDEREYGRLV